MVRTQVRQQLLNPADALTLATLQLGDGSASRGIRHPDLEGQAALIRYAEHEQPDCVRDGQPHRFERIGCPVLCRRVDSGTDVGVSGGHDQL
jgi:hypothetical protein